ncbi:MAG: hypothetical protein ACREYE_26300 [Gammaproteobacteria bacterium]
MKKSAALGISRSGGARDPHVFQYTLRLLVSSLRLAPAGLARRFAPGGRRLECRVRPRPQRIQPYSLGRESADHLRAYPRCETR